MNQNWCLRGEFEPPGFFDDPRRGPPGYVEFEPSGFFDDPRRGPPGYVEFEPPGFFDDPSGYAEYKKKLQRWARITSVDKKKQAEVVLFHLEGHSSGIQEKIDIALGNDIRDKDDGLAKLIKYLDGIYAEDDMVESWRNYKQFVRLVKNKQPLTEFVAEFEKRYKKAKDTGCEVSDTVLTFSLLEACELSDTDEKFVLSAIDFKTGKEKKDIFEQVKSTILDTLKYSNNAIQAINLRLEKTITLL